MRTIFIPIIGSIQDTPPTGLVRQGEYGLFPMDDGWYMIDASDEFRRLLTTADIFDSLIPFGTKSSSLDPGTQGQRSMDDDYFYLCTQSGAAGDAVWKRIPIFKSN